MKPLAIRLSHQPMRFWPGTRKTIAKSLVMTLSKGYGSILAKRNPKLLKRSAGLLL